MKYAIESTGRKARAVVAIALVLVAVSVGNAPQTLPREPAGVVSER